MKKFTFPFQQVLQLRERQRREAEIRQRQVAIELEQIRGQVVRLETQFEAQANRVTALPDAVCFTSATSDTEDLDRGEKPESLLMKFQQLASLGETLQLAERQADRISRDLKRANEQLNQATIEKEALLQLRDEQWRLYRQATARDVQKSLDENALRRWRFDKPGRAV